MTELFRHNEPAGVAAQLVSLHRTRTGTLLQSKDHEKGPPSVFRGSTHLRFRFDGGSAGTARWEIRAKDIAPQSFEVSFGPHSPRSGTHQRTAAALKQSSLCILTGTDENA